MNYNETLEYIHSLGMFSHPAGLERITALLHRLGNPQNSFEAVHIAGTNGKGSVAAYTSNIFRAAGLKTGLFISPFIIDFRERIQINGDFIPPDRLCELAERVRSAAVDVTEFEFITAMAFLYFAEEKCDIVVAETGLGGRLDATNTLSRVRVSVITRIGLDHTAILGNTFKKIAAEKCGIIKNDITVSAPHQPRTAAQVIRSSAKRLCIPDLRRLQVLKIGISGNEFIYRGVCYKTALGGEHQIENALTAIEAVRNSGLVNDDGMIRLGLAATRFPARLEKLFNTPLVILDGAHNPDGAVTLERAMREFSGKITGVVGMMKDKNCDGFLKTVLPHCRRVIAVKACDSPRALTADQMAELAVKYCNEVCDAESLEKAIAAALQSSKNDPVFIFGSLYLASAARKLLLER